MGAIRRGLEFFIGGFIIAIGALLCMTIILIPLGMPTLLFGMMIINLSGEERLRLKRDQNVLRDERVREMYRNRKK